MEAAGTNIRTTGKARRMLGVRATAEEQRIIAEAAQREHRSVSSFVLRAALEAARAPSTKPRHSREEVMAIVHAAQKAFAKVNDSNRDLLQELIDERRAEAAHE
jgi:hypothetical protein